jgi:hypothetical protein
MALRLLGHIELPPNRSNGGFDHADIHEGTDRLYVAHTSLAGALVSEARGFVFTSNRGENTVSVFAPGAERNEFKINVGMKPNGLGVFAVHKYAIDLADRFFCFD